MSREITSLLIFLEIKMDNNKEQVYIQRIKDLQSQLKERDETIAKLIEERKHLESKELALLDQENFYSELSEAKAMVQSMKQDLDEINSLKSDLVSATRAVYGR